MAAGHHRVHGGWTRRALALASLVALVITFQWARDAPFGTASTAPQSQSAAGNAPVPLEGGAGEAGEILLRADEFYAARAFPNAEVPPLALAEARVEADELSVTSEVQQLTPSAETVFEPPVAEPDEKTGGTQDIDPDATPMSTTAALADVAWAPVGTSGQTSYAGDLTFWNGQLPLAGRVIGIATHPTDANTAYIAAAAGGVWKTTNGGTNWAPVFDAQPSVVMGAVAIDPGTPTTVWAATGESSGSVDSYYGLGVYRSTDAGATWAKVGGTQFDHCHISDIVIKPGAPSVVLVSVDRGTPGPAGSCRNGFGQASSGIWRSADGGTTWSHVVASTGSSDLLASPASSSTFYAGDWQHGFIRSTDSGATWFLSTFGFPPSAGRGRVELAVAPSGSPLYAAVSTSTGLLLGLYSSTDGGINWGLRSSPPNVCSTSPLATGGQCFYDLTVAVSPNTPANVYLGGVYLQRSTDGGSGNWGFIGNGPNPNAHQIHVDFHQTVFDATGRLWVTSDGGVYRTADGTTFANLNATLNLNQFLPGISAAGTSLWGGTQDNGSARFTTGPGWQQYLAGDGGATAVDPTNSNVLFSTYVRLATYKSVNGGATNTLLTGLNPDGTTRPCLGDPISECLFYAPIVMDPNRPARIYAGTQRVWRTADSWTTAPVAISPKFLSTISAIAPAPSNGNVVYAGTSNGQLRVTTDNAATWPNTAGNGLPLAAVSDINVHPTDAARAWVALSGFDHGHIYLTTNSGASWTNISGNLPNTPVNAIVPDHRTSPATLYAGTDVGVFASADGGVTWTRFGTGLPNTVAMDVLVDTAGNRIVAATHGRGMWTAPIGTLPPTPTNGQIVFQRSDGNDYEIFLRHPDGSEVQLTDNTAADEDPVLSADGTLIAWATNVDGNYEIYKMNVDGTGKLRLTTNAATDEFPSWSPDQANLVFDSFRDGNYELYRMSATGGTATRLTSDPGEDRRAAWSPDGTRVAWWSNRGANTDIYVSPISFAGTPLRLTSNAAFDTQPAWSPDSTLIAYATTRTDPNPAGCTACNYEIFTLRADGTTTTPTQVTNSTGVDSYPTWSTDGTELAFASDRAGNLDLWKAAADGSNPVQLTTITGDDTEPHWQPPEPPCTDVFEPNDTRQTARPVTSGQTVSAVVCSGNDDYFSFGAAVGDQIRVETLFTHAAGDVDMTLFNPDGSLNTSAVSADDNELIDVTAATSGTYSVRVYGFQGAENAYQLTATVTPVGNPPPTVTVRTPVAGATGVGIGANMAATFSEAVQGVSNTTLVVRAGANVTTGATLPATVTQVQGTNRYVLNPTSNLVANTTYTVTAVGGAGEIRDLAGAPLVTTSWTFTTLNPPPTVTVRTPVAGATGVGIGANMAATFSEAVQGVSNTTFVVRAGVNVTTGPTLPATVTQVQGTNRYLLNPTSNLASSTTYTVTAVGGAGAIRDLAGAPLVTTSWTFTTGNTPPTVTVRTPAAGATGVAVGANMAATFSEAVQGVSNTTFVVRAGVNVTTGPTIPATVTQVTGTNRYLLNPTSNLAASTAYTVTVVGGAGAIRDLAGASLATTSWTFTTTA